MGARISIQFRHEEELSAVLSSHWGGQGFLRMVQEYARDLKKTIQEDAKRDIKNQQFIGQPLARYEPDVVLIDFIRHAFEAYYFTDPRTTAFNRILGDLRVATTVAEVDNSDYGHHIIDL